LLKYGIKQQLLNSKYDYYQYYFELEQVMNCEKFYKSIVRRIEGISDILLVSKEQEKFKLFMDSIKRVWYILHTRAYKERQKNIAQCLNLIFSYGYKMTLDNWRYFITTEIPINKILDKNYYSEYKNALYEVKEYKKLLRQTSKQTIYETKIIDIDDIIKKYKL